MSRSTDARGADKAKRSKELSGSERLAVGFARKFDLPLETVTERPIIKLIGNELTILNHHGLLEYTDTVIKIKAKPNNITVTGSGLTVRTIDNEALFLTGRIECLSYEY